MLLIKGTMAVVEDITVYASRQLEMGNSVRVMLRG